MLYLHQGGEVKAVTRFVAIDGTEFFDEYGCREYENVCQEISDLTAPWPEEKIRGEAFVQQDKNVVLRIQRAMVDIFERRHWKDRHTEWARNADVPAGMTLIGRYVDDAGCRPERLVWSRIARLDRLFREYEQPYYAIQADKRLDECSSPQKRRWQMSDTPYLDECNANYRSRLAREEAEEMRIRGLETRSAQLEAALRDAASRLRVAAIAGGSDPKYADLAVERYTKLLDSSTETAGYPPATPPSDGWPKAGGVQVPCPCCYGGYSCRRRKNHLKANEYCWRDRQAAGLAQQTTVERINRSRGTCTCGSPYGPHDPDCPAADTSKTK